MLAVYFLFFVYINRKRGAEKAELISKLVFNKAHISVMDFVLGAQTDGKGWRISINLHNFMDIRRDFTPAGPRRVLFYQVLKEFIQSALADFLVPGFLYF